MIGTLTASHDGKVLASYFSYTNSNTIQLYHFNNATGVITDNAMLPTAEFVANMQFSPDNSKLYTTCSDGLIQYDFNQADVVASRTVIYNELYSSFYDMQLAPDGKIYMAKTTVIENGNYNEYTGAIRCPNLPQYAANFNPKELSILPTNFPDLINDFIQDPKADPVTKFSLGNDTSLCFGSYILKAPDGWESYRWNTGETTKKIEVKKAGLYYVLTGNTGFSCPSGYGYINIADKASKLNLGADTSLCPSSTYLLHINNGYTNINWQNNSHNRDSLITTSNQYIISANDANGCYTSDSINIYFKQYPQASFGKDTTLCNNQPLKLTLLPEKSSFYDATYAWQDGSKNDTYVITKSGNYWGTATYDGCTASDTIKVAYITADKVHLGNDTTLCSGDSLQVMADVSNSIYLWNTGETTQSIFVKTPGSYYVLAGNGNCTVTDTIQINMTPKPLFTLGNDTVLCTGQKIVLSSFQYADKYKWQDGSVVSSYEATGPGLYWLQLTQNGCSASDSIKIESKPLPTVSLGKDTGFCKDSSLILNAYNPDAKSYLWGDGSTDEQYEVTSGGQYAVHITGKNGCISADTILVTETVPPVFSLGKDTTLCQNSELSYNFNLSNATYLWSNGSSSPYQTIFQSGNFWLTITQQGCTGSDSIEINYKPSPIVNLGNDTILCEGVTKLLNATNQNATYLWQDKSVSSQYEVNKAGLYFVRTSIDGCSADDSISIKYTPMPVFDLGKDIFLCKGASLMLNSTVNTAVSYLWQDGTIHSFYEVKGAGMYTLTATNSCGSLKDSIRILSEICKLNMPSAFTPNKDGSNDIFKVKYPFSTKQFNMVIYNRWGQKIFESKDIVKGWNGTINNIDQDPGTYIWTISLIDADDIKQTAQGTVALIR